MSPKRNNRIQIAVRNSPEITGFGGTKPFGMVPFKKMEQTVAQTIDSYAFEIGIGKLSRMTFTERFFQRNAIPIWDRLSSRDLNGIVYKKFGYIRLTPEIYQA